MTDMTYHDDTQTEERISFIRKIQTIVITIWQGVRPRLTTLSQSLRERGAAIRWDDLRTSMNHQWQRVPARYHKWLIGGIATTVVLLVLLAVTPLLLTTPDTPSSAPVAENDPQQHVQAQAPAPQVVLVGQPVNESVQQPAIARPIAPLYSDTVQHWAFDIADWTYGTRIDPNLLASVMQVRSCGNPQQDEGGLFGIPAMGAVFNEPALNAQAAIARLEDGLRLTGDDLRLTFAYFVDGETVLTRDFMDWSQDARDLFIVGYNVYSQAQSQATHSPDLASWLSQSGAYRCQQAQLALNP